MRELEVLVDGHRKLDFADIQEFFAQDLTERVRSAIKRLIEQALLAERDRYLASGDRIIYGVILHLNSSWEKKRFFKFTQNPWRYPLSVPIDSVMLVVVLLLLEN